MKVNPHLQGSNANAVAIVQEDAMSADTMEKPKNSLQHQTSPYLLQHATNPVDWYPWGEDAFQKAAREDKPILLSIGYSSCHWCHVMARESFADPEIAELLNRVFVNVKVDREERPDIDQLYMQVCHMMTGRGGWPLTIIMTPNKKPVFAATYLPPHSRGGMLGLAEMTLKIGELWQQQRQKVHDSAEQIADSIELAMRSEKKAKLPLHADLARRAFEDLLKRFDEKHGGFGMAPKFPSIHNLLFLLNYWKTYHEETALKMVERSLERMRAGGIFDQIGFGFHRYSTDTSWVLPHFEKMLYDQAMFALIYADAFAATGKKEFADTVDKIISYVLSDLTAPGGAFFSAQDADSEGEEGKFYLWTVEEINTVLGSDLGKFAVELYGMTPAGNFADESTGRRTGANIALRQKDIAHLADQFGLNESEVLEKTEKIRAKLFVARSKRTPPRIDDKILVDWNGLMIAALARAGRLLKNKIFVHAAEKAAEFLWQHCHRDKNLSHSYCKGEVSTVGFFADHAYFAWGLFELYQATLEARHLRKARQLVDEMLQRFWDQDHDDFFLHDPSDKDLFTVSKENADGAIPSATGVALFLLNRFATLSGEDIYADRARRLSATLGGEADRVPLAFLSSLYFNSISDEKSTQVIFCGTREEIINSPMYSLLQSSYHPSVAVFLESEAPVSPLAQLIPGMTSCSLSDAKPTALVCKDRQCMPPVKSAKELQQMLAK